MPWDCTNDPNPDPRDENSTQNDPIDFTDIENEPGQAGGPPPDIRTKDG